MKYTVKLNDNKDFVSLYKKGKYAAGRCCTVYFRKNGRGVNRVGFSSGKKVGNAVCRNRARRVMRQAYRETEEFFPKGLDIVFTAKEPASECKTYHIVQFILKKVIPRVNEIYINAPERR